MGYKERHWRKNIFPSTLKLKKIRANLSLIFKYYNITHE